MLTEKQQRKREYNKKYYEKNKERIDKYQAEYYKKNKQRLNQYSKEYGAKYYSGYRNKVLEHLGGKCTRCGFDDYRALQIDHVNGGGSKERSLNMCSSSYYRKVLKDTEGTYQLLCANCNWIKRYERKEH